MTILTTDNFVMFAARCYKKRLCISQQAFFNDLSSLEIKTELTRYKNTQDPRLIRVIINKLVIACNLFGPDSVELVLFRLSGDNLKLCQHIYSELGILNSEFEFDEKLAKEIRNVIKV